MLDDLKPLKRTPQDREKWRLKTLQYDLDCGFIDLLRRDIQEWGDDLRNSDSPEVREKLAWFELEAVRFAAIWSNPPIRIGKDELHSLLKLWLPRLAPGGTAWLVVQKNLGSDSLHRWLMFLIVLSSTAGVATLTADLVGPLVFSFGQGRILPVNGGGAGEEGAGP